MAPIRGLDLVCPVCRERLAPENEGYGCPACQRAYPLLAGIPDLRLAPDPFLDFEQDGERARAVLARLNRLPLAKLLEYYWSLSEITPPQLRARFVDNALRGERRGRRILRLLNERGVGSRAARLLDVGSGTGNLLLPASQRFREVVGVDVGMRWLHLSRRRFLEHGLETPPLLCCGAEALPFPSQRFEVVVMASTLEFVRDPAAALAECARVLTPGGLLYLGTVNRHSLAASPYTGLRGVGFLPRRWQAGYVRRRSGASYENIRPLALSALRRLAGACFARCEVSPADVDDVTLAELAPGLRAQVRAYRALKRLPVTRSLLLRVAPEWDVVLGEPRSRHTATSSAGAT